MAKAWRSKLPIFSPLGDTKDNLSQTLEIDKKNVSWEKLRGWSSLEVGKVYDALWWCMLIYDRNTPNKSKWMLLDQSCKSSTCFEWNKMWKLQGHTCITEVPQNNNQSTSLSKLSQVVCSRNCSLHDYWLSSKACAFCNRKKVSFFISYINTSYYVACCANKVSCMNLNRIIWV